MSEEQNTEQAHQPLSVFRRNIDIIGLIALIVAGVAAYLDLKHSVDEHQAVLPKGDDERLLTIPSEAIRHYNSPEVIEALTVGLSELKTKAIEVEKAAEVAFEEALEDADEIEVIHRKLKKFEDIDAHKVVDELHQKLRSDKEFLQQLPKYELVIADTASSSKKWASGDSACVLSCPTGYVLVSAHYENPSGAADCSPGKCVKHALRLK